MIKLFNIPNRVLDTSKYNHLLHGKVVTEFEKEFARYVGAKYAVSVNSATSAIYLILDDYAGSDLIRIPNMIPPTVYNALVNAGVPYKFVDDTEWVGNSYILLEDHENKYKVIDSAQKVNPFQFNNEAEPNDLMVFSFYPTKPVGGCDGGMVVSDDERPIERIRLLANNGLSASGNSWDKKRLCPGYKMHMNSLQADFALQSLRELPVKQETLTDIRNMYNEAFGLKNTSLHLYRVNVRNKGHRDQFIMQARVNGIECGIHYKCILDDSSLPNSLEDSLTTVSIPFHEKLTYQEIQRVIEYVKPYIRH